MIVVRLSNDISGLLYIFFGIFHGDSYGSGLNHGNIVGFISGSQGIGQRNIQHAA